MYDDEDITWKHYVGLVVVIYLIFWHWSWFSYAAVVAAVVFGAEQAYVSWKRDHADRKAAEGIKVAATNHHGFNIGEVTLVNVHSPSQCAGENCVIHNPSDHHMRLWPMLWRADRRLMERTCSHGVGHPDPDDFAYWKSVGQEHKGLHGCDGCCAVDGVCEMGL
jgi:hypothetical protein